MYLIERLELIYKASRKWFITLEEEEEDISWLKKREFR
jgi:hypothetical protein